MFIRPDLTKASSDHRRSGVVALGLFTISVMVTVSVVTWLGWTGAEARNEMRAASQRAVRVAELRGTIAYLDEWLTMSAQMAATTGQPTWADRYEEAVPKLDAAIAEASGLATPEVRAALGRTTDEAHRDLVLMERRALALAADGDLTGARALLNGPEFAYLKDVYASGIEEFGAELKTLADARAADLNDRAWLEAAGLGLIAVLLVSTALTVRTQRRLKRAAARTAAMARTDALTDLPNRRRFYEELETALAGKPPVAAGYALLLLDLDRFRAANDAFGHAAGDELLRLVAARLKGIVRAGDLIARLSGDEFAIVLPLDDGQVLPSSEPAQVARRILAILSEPFGLGDGILAQIGASIGVAFAQRVDERVGDLMHRAEVALYRAKADGRGCFRFFEPAMDDHVRSRALLESELRQAVTDDAIVPHFQPLIEIVSGRLIGVEMLARWPHPTRGMVSPGEFIPIAEDLGLIGPLTHNLLRRACRAAAGWPPHVTLACNVSPVQLRDPSLSATIRTILDETGFPASRLEIEVTESALVGDLKLARALLDDLKALGVRLALDDFGTGYSGLRHLHLLPFDKLKIDASFVGAMTDDRESRKIVAAVVGLGQSLGLSIVAEGVETEDTLALLKSLGCDIGQGWLFGRPAPAERIDAMLLRDGVRLAS